jgi:Omp85 superfamily domain
MRRTRRSILLPLCLGFLPGGRLPAQNVQSDSVTVTAGARYGTGALHDFFFGRYYRDLWTTPLRVARLDLGRFAGGLEPVRRGGGFQTKSLRFRAPDGQEYAFRSVDKDPSSILPPELRETLVDRIVQDQISSGHPAGALIVAPLLDAVGVLHAEPRLFVMPDDARLGEFRAEFHDMLGTIEVVPNEGTDTLPGFMGASRIIGTDRLLERIEEDLEAIDARAFLSARLVDAYLGDWDRHRDQWRWARFGETRDSLWRPIPRDRDQAFVRMDGFLLRIARQYFPQLVNFGESYPAPLGLTWNGRELDRRLLVGLEWPAWDSVANRLVSLLDDGAIDRAIAALPPEYSRIDGRRLGRALRARRDALPVFARRFYEMLATDVDVHTTDAPEQAEIIRIEGGNVDVRVTAKTATGDIDVFRRTFHRGETDDLRLFLHGGADSVRVTGNGDGGITIRVIGGGGDDVFTDASRAGGSRFYDDAGDNVFERGNGVRIDEREYEYPGPPHSPSQPPRDWGRQYRYPLWVLGAPDVGLMAGIGVDRFDYGFRTWPFASHVRARAAFATAAQTFRVEAGARYNRENSATHFTVEARASGLEILRFYGFGNETPLTADDEASKVSQKQFELRANWVHPLGEPGELSIGPVIRYATTEEEADRLIDQLNPYGAGGFGQAGVTAGLGLDSRDIAAAPTRGATLSLAGRFFPAIWDVTDSFGSVQADATTYLSAPLPLRPTLALRAGGTKIWGPYPFADAAYIGDAETVRLGYKQRFAGDAEVHANAELRLHLVRTVLVLPADFGVFGLWDTGRVWYGDEDSRRWHRAAGAGISIAVLQPASTLTFALSRAAEKTGIYIRAGFAY